MRKYLKFVALCLLAAVILAWFGRSLNWAEVSGAIGRADRLLIAAAVVLVWLTYLIRAFRWRTLLAPLAPRASLREAFAATTVGFGATFLVGRAVGEVLRPAFLSVRDREVRPGPAFVTIAVERLFDTAAVVVLFAGNMLVLRLPGVGEDVTARIRTWGLVLLVATLVGLAALAWLRRHAGAATRWLDAKLEKMPRFFRRPVKIFGGLLGETAQALGVLSDARELLIVVGWTALLWAMITLANMLVLRAFGLTLGVSETVFVLGWSLVGSLVPTPGGGAGTYHAATAYSLITYFGVDKQDAAATTIVLNLVVFGSALFFGLYYFLRSGLSIARLRELVARQEAEAEAGRRAEADPLIPTLRPVRD
ncbi:MAG TPA: lysylphosphatidylglycerol synthase transmembrane domain-containing protein [Pyrinomonadaceae bacterium]|nr:lysylphosphatidylglycerol synthase transmembrane domain-containing protein [Pyrinomonadaceae bacterium]